MNSEKVRYFLSISNKTNDEAFMVVFFVFSFGKKRISSEFSPFERSLSFEGCYFHLGGVCLLKTVIFQDFILLKDRHFLNTF